MSTPVVDVGPGYRWIPRLKRLAVCVLADAAMFAVATVVYDLRSRYRR